LNLTTKKKALFLPERIEKPAKFLDIIFGTGMGTTGKINTLPRAKSEKIWSRFYGKIVYISD